MSETPPPPEDDDRQAALLGEGAHLSRWLIQQIAAFLAAEPGKRVGQVSLETERRPGSPAHAPLGGPRLSR